MISELLRIACAMKAKTLCDGLFLSRRERRVIEREDLGFHPLFRLVCAAVEPRTRRVTSSLLGTGLFSAEAIFVEGLGAVLLSGMPEAEVRDRLRMPGPRDPEHPANAPWPLGDGEPVGSPSRPSDPEGLKAAVDGLFHEAARGRKRRTRAVLVVHEDRIVAEQYAPGISADTPLIGWSMAKSVVTVLAGVLAARGKLDIHALAAAPEWRREGDGRAPIRLDHLLRMSSGLQWQEAYEQDPVTDVQRMLFREPDMASYAAAKPLEAAPDTVWNYSSGSTNIACRAMREAFEDLAAYLAFPRGELFTRIGMQKAALATDASGSFIGSSYLYAAARDYARFGLFCLHDGVWDGKRILPEAWMSYATSPTATAPRGEYGAGFWLNRGPAGNPDDRPFPKLPQDLYYASGHHGQLIAVVPSRELVVVRLGMTGGDGDWGAEEFMQAVLAAL